MIVILRLRKKRASWRYIKKLTEYTYNNGHVSVVYAGIMPIYLITDPDDCYKVSTTCLERPGFANKFLKQFLGNGLLTGPGTSQAIWKQHRKLINPAFNQQVVDSFMGIFNAQSRRLVETLKNHVGKGQFDHHDHLEKTALETISLTMAGVDISNQKEFNYKCLMAFRAVVDGVIARAKNPLYYFDNIYRTSILKKIEDAHVKITHELTEQVLKKKREVYATEDNKESSEKTLSHSYIACWILVIRY
ncbi:cytochrome P450 4g15-like isoform X3 [Pieris brassicae]|uniref:cytochrome P450 4g15-like isoform X3 n=1 Tax=Pieris brassicae TaxID=7116 RepID=UPI001E66122B|nr:cytochrome P450 4g15-like isoform X3 [Pieris brassicae]